ncbi:MAG: shikimate kinase [Bacteroidota bacterium]
MRKINVIGTSGSGKSTLAKALATKLGYPYIEMDALFWQANWTETPDKDFFPKVQAALDQETWVLDGNYTRTIPIKWEHADTAIWIDLSFWRTLYQVSRRTMIRLFSGVELWPGTNNRQTLQTFFSKHNIILWSLRNYFPTRRKYLRMMVDPAYSHIRFVHLSGRKAVRTYLAAISVDQE